MSTGNITLTSHYSEYAASSIKLNCIEANNSNGSKWFWKTYCGINLTTGFISGYILPVYAFVGIITNAHIVWIFNFRIPRASRTRQMVYLSWNAVADFANILVLGYGIFFLYNGLDYVTDARFFFPLPYMTSISCTVCSTAYVFTGTFTSLLFVATCLDRCLTVYFHMKFRKLTPKSATIVCLLVLFCSAVLTAPFPALVRLVKISESIEICSFPSPNLSLIIYLILFVQNGSLQAVAVVVINIALGIKLKLIQANRKLLIANSRALVTPRRDSSKRMSTNEIHATILIVLLSAGFIVCGVSQAICFALFSLFNYNYVSFLFESVGQLFSLLYLLQESVNWFIYFWRMRVFRKACIDCVCRR